MILKQIRISALVMAFGLAASFNIVAATDGPATSEFKGIVTKIQAKVREGKTTEADFASEIKALDQLTDRYRTNKTDEVANIFLNKANFYLQVLDDTDKGKAIVNELLAEFPETNAGENAVVMLDAIHKQENAKRLQAKLSTGALFPEVAFNDLSEKSVSLRALKGQVVLIDFWGSWNEPWNRELPALVKLYENYHAKGFEILGINLDQDPRVVAAFAKDKKMRWSQFCDGSGWENKVAVATGVHRLPASYLLDKEGKILGRNLKGQELEAAIKKALETK